MNDMDSKPNSINQRYDRNYKLVLSEASPDGGVDPLFPRLSRAALNQRDDGAPARYGFFANTVMDNIIKGMELTDSGRVNDARRHFTRAANAMSAFADHQREGSTRRCSVHRQL
jgi:hypothetical protein